MPVRVEVKLSHWLCFSVGGNTSEVLREVHEPGQDVPGQLSVRLRGARPNGAGFGPLLFALAAAGAPIARWSRCRVASWAVISRSWSIRVSCSRVRTCSSSARA